MLEAHRRGGESVCLRIRVCSESGGGNVSVCLCVLEGESVCV